MLFRSNKDKLTPSANESSIEVNTKHIKEKCMEFVNSYLEFNATKCKKVLDEIDKLNIERFNIKNKNEFEPQPCQLCEKFNSLGSEFEGKYILL